jgi:hypothetical protein
MRNYVIVKSTAPFGKGLSKKLKKGSVYYVQIAKMTDWEDEEEDLDTPVSGWVCMRKVIIK